MAGGLRQQGLEELVAMAERSVKLKTAGGVTTEDLEHRRLCGRFVETAVHAIRHANGLIRKCLERGALADLLDLVMSAPEPHWIDGSLLVDLGRIENGARGGEGGKVRV